VLLRTPELFNLVYYLYGTINSKIILQKQDVYPPLRNAVFINFIYIKQLNLPIFYLGLCNWCHIKNSHAQSQSSKALLCRTSSRRCARY